MTELTPGQHQARRTARIKGLPMPGGAPPEMSGQPPMRPGIGQGIGGGRMQGPGMPPSGGMPPRMPPVSPSGPAGAIPPVLPPGSPLQPAPPWAPAPGARPMTYDLATTMEGARTGGLPPVGRQFGGGLPVGLGGRPSPIMGDAGMLARKNQLQSQALAPQFG